MTVSFVGFEPAISLISVQGAIDLGTVLLEQTSIALDELVVLGGRRPADRAAAGLQVLRPGDLRRVPTPGLSYDLAGYLLSLPGFVSTGDRGGQLFVRGGTSTQNLMLVDGIPVMQPFHMIGFYSAVPADLGGGSQKHIFFVTIDDVLCC